VSKGQLSYTRGGGTGPGRRRVVDYEYDES